MWYDQTGNEAADDDKIIAEIAELCGDVKARGIRANFTMAGE